MPLDPQLLTQVLSTPGTQDVTQKPIVTAIILQDPAYAADLVDALEKTGTLEAYNARLILCMFGYNAVPALVAKLASAGPNARREGVEVLWALLITENPATIRDSLKSVKGTLNQLLDDTTPLPEDFSVPVEIDFHGRLCDFTYIVIRQLLSPNFDQSSFRSMDNHGRDGEIAILKRDDLSLRLA